jgi:hypothetical protein
MSGLIFGPVTVGSSIQRVGVVPRCLVADSPEELRSIVVGGFSDDQFRLINYGIARDCYDGNFQPYLQDWIGNDEARAWTARYIPIMRRVCDLLSMHLYKKGPTREIAGHPEATALLQQIYAANDFDSLMQLADRTSYITDSCAIEFVPNDGPDAIQTPVTDFHVGRLPDTLGGGNHLHVWSQEGCPRFHCGHDLSLLVQQRGIPAANRHQHPVGHQSSAGHGVRRGLRVPDPQLHRRAAF